MLFQLATHWRVVLLLAATPLLLWLIALAGYLLLLVFGALYYGLVLLWAFLTLVLFR